MPKQSSGIDEISSHFVTVSPYNTAPNLIYLTIIFSYLLYFPPPFKYAEVFPLHKIGRKMNIINFGLNTPMQSSGIDEISSRFVTVSPYNTAPNLIYLTIIFSYLLYFPPPFKYAEVFPLHKIGRKMNIINFGLNTPKQ